MATYMDEMGGSRAFKSLCAGPTSLSLHSMKASSSAQMLDVTVRHESLVCSNLPTDNDESSPSSGTITTKEKGDARSHITLRTDTAITIYVHTQSRFTFLILSSTRYGVYGDGKDGTNKK